MPSGIVTSTTSTPEERGVSLLSDFSSDFVLPRHVPRKLRQQLAHSASQTEREPCPFGGPGPSARSEAARGQCFPDGVTIHLSLAVVPAQNTQIVSDCNTHRHTDTQALHKVKNKDTSTDTDTCPHAPISITYTYTYTYSYTNISISISISRSASISISMSPSTSSLRLCL